MLESQLEFWAIRRKSDGHFFGVTSEAPTLYTSAGKAEGRRKTIDVTRKRNYELRTWEKVDRQDYEVVKFAVTVVAA